MGRVRLGKRRGLVGGQRVDAAAAVDLVAGHVGVVPRALAHGHGARDDAGRYLHDDLHGAAVVEHLHGVAVGQVAFGGVQRVHPQLAGVRLLPHLDVAVGGMAAALEVEAGQLQRVFLRQRVGVALGLGAVHRQRADELIVVQLPGQKPALSDVMLETLSIIAYKQPVTKAEIEKIRGVKCDHAINKLVEYSLVRELGRLDAPGRPILLGTTEEFLRCFGVQDLESLPVPDPVQIEDFKAEAEEEIQLKLDV